MNLAAFVYMNYGVVSKGKPADGKQKEGDL